jgi:hypothetical protein
MGAAEDPRGVKRNLCPAGKRAGGADRADLPGNRSAAGFAIERRLRIPIRPLPESGPLIKSYFLQFVGGRARSGAQSAIRHESYDWTIYRDGTTRVVGGGGASAGGTRSAGTYRLSFSGRMSNVLSRMRGTLGNRSCDLALWRATTPENPSSACGR